MRNLFHFSNLARYIKFIKNTQERVNEVKEHEIEVNDVDEEIEAAMNIDIGLSEAPAFGYQTSHRL